MQGIWPLRSGFLYCCHSGGRSHNQASPASLDNVMSIRDRYRSNLSMIPFVPVCFRTSLELDRVSQPSRESAYLQFVFVVIASHCLKRLVVDFRLSYRWGWSSHVKTWSFDVIAWNPSFWYSLQRSILRGSMLKMCTVHWQLLSRRA